MSILASDSSSRILPLGIKVSNSEAPRRAGFRPPLPAPLISAPPLKPSQLAEILRPLQASAQSQRCGSWIGGKARLSTFGDGQHGIIGFTASCSSPRCPRCRVSLMATRRDEIQACIDWWTASPLNRVSMLTLTAPHTPDHSLPRLLGSTKKRFGLAGAVALLKERALWKRDVREYVSGQETTQGGNGWHPHYHLLIFHVGDLDVDSWYHSWAQACKDAGLGRPSRVHGLTIQPAESAAGYMAKWGLAAEQTGAHVKDAKHGNRAVWDLEQSAAQGNRSSRHLLKQYYRAMRRRRTHTFSRGLAPIRLKHALGFKPARAHFLFDTASSFKLHQDRDFKAVLLQVLADYQLPVMQVFGDLGLEAQPVDYSITPPPQMPYSVLRRVKALVCSSSRYPEIDKQCFDLININKEYCLSIIKCKNEN